MRSLVDPWTSGLWGGILGGLAMLAVAGVGAALLGPYILKRTLGRMTTHLMRDPYGENLAEYLPTLKRLGTVELMEITMRAEQGGKPPSRPWGSQRVFSPWDQLLLNPVYLHRLPTPDDVKVDTRVVIGPQAHKPLIIDIPIMIAAMSFGGALSSKAKVALAKAATRAGTATNTGEAFLPAEREAAEHLVIQYIRGGWPNSSQHRPDILKRADAIEIQVGQGAQAGAPQRTLASHMDEEMRQVFGLKPGQDAVIHARLDGIDRPEDFIPLVKGLKNEYGVPVGIKFGATHHQERELEVALRAGVDFIVVDGAEGGTHGASPTLEDDTGLPTMHALVRTLRFLQAAGERDKVSVLAAGGLRTPGQFLKAMALGADAVYVGTAAGMAMVAAQATKVIPGEPPSVLAFHASHLKDRLDIDRAAVTVADFLKASVKEMEQVCVALGKTALSQLSPADLVALDPQTAAIAGVDLAYALPPAQPWPVPAAASGRRSGRSADRGPARGPERGEDRPQERSPERDRPTVH
ncbi:MAG: FMN-binding glutamate synthase family protein [Symbiobacteriia bacterium]